MSNGQESPVLVHSDLRSLIRRMRVPSSERRQLTSDVVKSIRSAFAGRPLWMPAFNYDFAQSGLFDVRLTPSRVGVLSEDFRTTTATWRSPVPVFSIAGEGAGPDFEVIPNEVWPFGSNSLLAHLTRARGSVVMVGCGISFAILMHHAEVASGLEPLYRFDKTFEGLIIDSHGASRTTRVTHHVTDLRRRVTYDWSRIEDVMIDEGAISTIELLGGSWLIDASMFVDIWVDRVAKDPLWAISDQSRTWVEPLLSALGRRFRLADFEREESID